MESRIMDEGFRSGYEAIGWALRRTSTPIVDGPSIWELGRKEGSRDFMPELNDWEKLAEAALILRNVERCCRPHHEAIILTYFMGGTVVETAVLISYISKNLGRDKWFVQDIVMNWARGWRGHTGDWWAKKYRVSIRTIQRWALKIKQMLSDMFDFAMSLVDDALVESGHVV